MSSYRAVWGREPGPGPSFLRVSRWGTVWYWTFLCFTWCVPVPLMTRELFSGRPAWSKMPSESLCPDWPGPINLLILLRCMS